MSQATTADVPDHPPIHRLLELRYDGTVAVTAKRGCTDEDIRDLLSQLTGGMQPADSACRGDAA